MTRINQRTTSKHFKFNNETIKKLTELRVIHNKPYVDILELLIDNAYALRNENKLIEEKEKFEEQNLKNSFQVQQLTLMISELQKEIQEQKTQILLHEQIIDYFKNRTDAQSKNITLLNNKFKNKTNVLTELIKEPEEKENLFQKTKNFFKGL